MIYDYIIAGGGAAGFFSAINLLENNGNLKVLILEKSAKFLDKVRISGGGRCNVTHACWEPKELVKYYPRGQKELLGPFSRFMTGDMVGWLEDHGVETKIENDGRIFPSSNTSQTIIDCFLGQAQKFNIETRLSVGVKDFTKVGETFQVLTTTELTLQTKHIVMATGGTKTVWELLKSKGIEIKSPIPSLFTFKIEDELIADLPGLVAENARLKIRGFQMETVGPVLVTHWGLSGPGVLKLSSWAARYLHAQDYKIDVHINWLDESEEAITEQIKLRRATHGANKISHDNFLSIPKRLWKNICKLIKVSEKNWADLSKDEMKRIIQTLHNTTLIINGKTTNKDEFVTSGGVDLREVNFKTMESKKIPNLFFAGEVLNIDALTGGFNFQAAWTEAWIVAQNELK